MNSNANRCYFENAIRYFLNALTNNGNIQFLNNDYQILKNRVLFFFSIGHVIISTLEIIACPNFQFNIFNYRESSIEINKIIINVISVYNLRIIVKDFVI